MLAMDGGSGTANACVCYAPESGCQNMTGQRLMMKVCWRRWKRGCCHIWPVYIHYARPEITRTFIRHYADYLIGECSNVWIVNCLRITLCRREAGSPFVIMDNLPALAVRMQEMFGEATNPTIAQGRVPLVLELLSPAQRPLQITRDLGAFWKGAYREVAKEMKGVIPNTSGRTTRQTRHRRRTKKYS